VRVDAHNDDAYRQDNLIDAAIASNAAILILDNAGADSSVSAVRRATKAGIRCFLIDRAISAIGIAKAQIVSDNGQGARLVAQEFVRALNGTGEYVELLGRESDTNAQVRTKGFHAVLDGGARAEDGVGAECELEPGGGLLEDGDDATGARYDFRNYRRE